jgi:predicted Fe-Mo cluster-binding NifX family protein
MGLSASSNTHNKACFTAFPAMFSRSVNGQIKNVHVIDNPAVSYKYGSGPVAVKTLADLKVDLVFAAEFGPGASRLLEHHIKKVSVKPNTKVSDAVKEMPTKKFKG